MRVRSCRAHSAQDRHTHPCLVVLQLPGNAADLRRAGKFHLGQKIDEMLFSAPAQPDLLLLLLVFEHGFHGHTGDQRHVMDLVGISCDTDDALLVSVMHDRHVDTWKHAREHPLIPDHDHVLRPMYNTVRHLVVGPDSLRVAACNDHTRFVHDIDVVFRILRDLLNKPARQFGFDHGCLLDLITSQHELHSDPSFRGPCIRYKPLPSRARPAHS